MSYTITCPICGPRDGYEFKFGNEERGPVPSQKGITRDQYTEYHHNHTATAGAQEEWWCHTGGCGVWFKIWRDTVTEREVKPMEAGS